MSMPGDKGIMPLGTSLGSSKGGSSGNVKPNKEVIASQAQFSKDAANTPSPSKVSDTENRKSQANIKGNHGNTDEEKAVTAGDGLARSQKRPNRSIEDSLSDNEIEGPGVILSSLARESIGNSIVNVSNTLPERRAKASKRLLQAKAYAELVEDRIQDLERKVRDLRNEKDSLMEENSSPEAIPSIIHLVQMGWTDFNHRTIINRNDFTGTWGHRPELDETSRPVIEILVEEPYYGLALSGSGKQSVDGSKSQLSAPDLPNFQTNGFSAEPYQIRIRSKLLLKTLKEITGCKVTVGPHEHRLLLLRPFKLLVHFEQVIRNHIRNMELANSGDGADWNHKRATNEESCHG